MEANPQFTDLSNAELEHSITRLCADRSYPKGTSVHTG